MVREEYVQFSKRRRRGKTARREGRGEPTALFPPPFLFPSPRTHSLTNMISTDVLYHSCQHGNLSLPHQPPLPPNSNVVSHLPIQWFRFVNWCVKDAAAWLSTGACSCPRSSTLRDTTEIPPECREEGMAGCSRMESFGSFALPSHRKHRVCRGLFFRRPGDVDREIPTEHYQPSSSATCRGIDIVFSCIIIINYHFYYDILDLVLAFGTISWTTVVFHLEIVEETSHGTSIYVYTETGTGRHRQRHRHGQKSRVSSRSLGMCTLLLSVTLIRHEHTKNVSEKKIGNSSCAHPLTLFSKSPTKSTAASD